MRAIFKLCVVMLLVTPIAVFAQSDPTNFPLTPICDVKVDEDGDCITDAIDDTVCVRGLVLAWKQFGTRGPGAIYDPESGCCLSIFDITSAPDLQTGQFVEVCGWVGNFAGLAEITDKRGSGDEDPVVTVLDSVPAPVPCTPVNGEDLQDFNPLAEELESHLVEVCGQFVDSGIFDITGSGNNYDFVAADGNTIEIRVDRDTDIDGSPIPVGNVTVKGVLGQFNGFSDECVGYQVLPRSFDDFLPPTCEVELDLKPTSCPNPLNPRSNGVYPAAILGSELLDVTTIDVSTLELAGVAPIRTHVHDASGPWMPPNLLMNAGFESPDASGGDVYGTADWFGFNDHFTTAVVSRSGSQALKIFGPFFPGGGAGAGQNVGAASEGDVFRASAWALNWSGDPIDPSNFAVVKIEFLDAGNAVIGFAESPQITSALPLDTWTEFSVEATAPMGTASVQLILVHVQLEPITGGSVFFDDAYMALMMDKPECACIEAGPDGFDDLTLKFRNQDLVAALGPLSGGDEIPLTITGRYLDGTAFSGTDCVIVRYNGGVPGDRGDFSFAISRDGLQKTAQIAYTLPQDTHVTLGVYNVAGRLVDRIVSGPQSAGSYDLVWSTTGHASGLYLFKLETRDFVETRKVMLLN
ncbi:MAG: T9SS type A sorting domain-containing protein [Candidatus Latescibacterota bacterium]|nr:MAG: T9SS type A sorting domain-containing protein [Candidatus Latescibacterota bacterium]